MNSKNACARGVAGTAAVCPPTLLPAARAGTGNAVSSASRRARTKIMKAILSSDGVYISVMPVDAELLEILACPACKTPVTLVKQGTALKCASCHRVYPIKDDIPVMLIDEATVEP